MILIREIIFDEKLPICSVREEIVNKLLSENSDLRKVILAESLAGRDILALHIGNDNNSVLFTAAYHGMEWLTSLILLKFLYDVCERLGNKYDRLYNSIKKRGITIVPCVNPDGVEISLMGASSAGEYESLVRSIGDNEMWQANARGVDINHNFDAGWDELHESEIKNGIVGPRRTRYGGIAPESEPETRSIVNLCNENYFDYAVALHSQGEEIYWDYGYKTPNCSLEMARKMAELSGYKVSKPEGLAVGGGFKDWFIEKINRPAFTVEIGKGINPLPLKDFKSIYRKVSKILYFLVEYGLD